MMDAALARHWFCWAPVEASFPVALSLAATGGERREEKEDSTYEPFPGSGGRREIIFALRCQNPPKICQKTFFLDKATTLHHVDEVIGINVHFFTSSQARAF